MHSRIAELAKKYFPDTVKTRRYLHQNPELSYQEFKTTEFIQSRLEELGIPHEKPLETGCIGVIKGGIESDRVVALRADIDALPIREEGDHKKDFMSKNEGVAHCCGHDSHTANMLGVANILTDLQDEI